MIRKSWSLRRRLLLWLLLPSLLVCALMLLQAYFTVRESVETVHDKILLGLALAVGESVVATHGTMIPDTLEKIFENISADEVFYRVLGPDACCITGYDDLPQAPNTGLEDGIPVYYDAVYRGRAMRMVELHQFFESGGLSGWVNMQVAMTRSDRDDLIRESLYRVGGRLLSLVLLVCTIIWFAVERGLRPLADLQQELRSRSAQDLQPIRSEVPKEVWHVVAAVNSLMQRLGASLSTMQRFIADASHQLRTPLAALQTQTELALRANDLPAMRAALEELQQTTQRTSRLVTQLLKHTHASNAAGAIKTSKLDLTALAAETTRSLVPLALKRDIDLGFEGNKIPPVQGDALLLREMLENLIDNAIHYCPAGAQVTVRTRQGSRQHIACLEVEDDGPGIPPAERERVFERFYRGSDVDIEGCGLGLPIVQEIVQAHGGTIRLDSGAKDQGLLVQVCLKGL